MKESTLILIRVIVMVVYTAIAGLGIWVVFHGDNSIGEKTAVVVIVALGYVCSVKIFSKAKPKPNEPIKSSM